MDINIFDALSEENSNSVVQLRKTGPWYADLYRGDSSFYQIRATVSGPSFRLKGEIALHFAKTGVTTAPTDNRMASKPLEGKWWENKDLRVLSDYRDDRMRKSDKATMSEFHVKVSQRIGHGYMFKSLMLHPDYWAGIRSRLEAGFKRPIEDMVHVID